MDFFELSNKIIQYQNLFKTNIILIDGFSCSGKTSFAKELKILFSEYITGEIYILPVDAFLIARDSRAYETDIKYLDLDSWYDIDKISNVFNAIFSNRTKIDLEFSTYQRETGKISGLYNISFNKENDLLIIEGLFSVKFTQIFGNFDNLQCIYFYSKISTIFKRILERNKYHSIEKVKYLFKNIYLPAFYNYSEYLENIDIIFNYLVNTTDFENLTILSNAKYSNFKYCPPAEFDEHEN